MVQRRLVRAGRRAVSDTYERGRDVTDEDVRVFFIWLESQYANVRPLSGGRWAAVADLFGDRGRIIVGQVGDDCGIDLGY
jgi:hypothetical protein